MHANDAADVFQRWATIEGMLTETTGSKVPTISTTETNLIKPIIDAGKNLLRSKKVQAVAFNDVNPAVIVLLRKAAPSQKLAGFLPAQVDDVPISYRQGVQSPIGSDTALPHGAPIYIVRSVGSANHYTCGSSISVGNWRDAGTLGCLVKDSKNELFGMSNNHITGSCSFAGVGLPILAPGVVDVAPNALPPFTVGFHQAALPLIAGSTDNVDHTKNLDAAIFRIRDPSLVSSYQGVAYDTPPQVAPLVADLVVEKVGRTTGHTVGKVVGQMNGAYGFPYMAALYEFSGRVYFDGIFAISGSTGLFSDNGDSGALITALNSEGQRAAVGIVVGGTVDGKAPGGKLTMALSIQRILVEFNVSLVSGHNI
jgi:hypothetical protein